MCCSMKTTVDIADDLAIKAKALARKKGTTLRALIEDGLRQQLEQAGKKNAFVLRDGSVGGNGLNPEFQGRSWEAIRDEIYKGRGT
jgi:hypothetical protein